MIQPKIMFELSANLFLVPQAWKVLQQKINVIKNFGAGALGLILKRFYSVNFTLQIFFQDFDWLKLFRIIDA